MNLIEFSLRLTSQRMSIVTSPSVLLRMIQYPLDALLSKYIILNVTQLSSIRRPNDILGVFQAILRPDICCGISPLEAVGVQVVNEAGPAGAHQLRKINVALLSIRERIDSTVCGVVT